ncbi:PspC domain-containing protein [Alkalibaculum sp. M08DMB]|uniref:PspC domain-containing protein n=1 Tax=Alkalibaculum sporogenes TaxID=2655001 RepID=A0A6A7K571_9FIRM|nr:PspC domain-containing protein [Alkalibaculum sporogenes]MPW24606.1 PspC domain-containing protein [Alkalibaculum sporogenes]
MNGKLTKSKNDKMILGVCGGVGEYLDVDSSIVRVLWAIASLVYGTGIILYIIIAFILPYSDENEEEIHNKQSSESKMDIKHQHNHVIAIILILSGVFLLLRNFTIFFDSRYVWPSFLVILGVLLIIKGKERKDEE